MKMQFSFVIDAEPDIEKRLLEKMQKIPNLQMNIIHGFGNLISMALDATPADKLSIVGFNAGKIQEKPSQESVEGKPSGNAA